MGKEKKKQRNRHDRVPICLLLWYDITTASGGRKTREIQPASRRLPLPPNCRTACGFSEWKLTFRLGSSEIIALTRAVSGARPRNLPWQLEGRITLPVAEGKVGELLRGQTACNGLEERRTTALARTKAKD